MYPAPLSENVSGPFISISEKGSDPFIAPPEKGSDPFIANPARAGMVEDPADYLWSSYRAHAFGIDVRMWTPKRLMKSATRPILVWCSDMTAFERKSNE